MEDDFEVVEIFEDTETLAHILTLIMKQLNPLIDSGPVYEIVLNLIIQMTYEPIVSLDIEEAATDLGRAILDTKTTAGHPIRRH